jgi:hypothetical protein
MIRKKRKELERFIREQTLGPGIMGYRLVDLQQQEDLLTHELITLLPLDNTNEIINNVPGAMYSTGILFPEDGSNTALFEAEANTSGDQPTEDGVDGTHEAVIDQDVSDDDAISINQMYPNTMGLSVCLDSRITDLTEINLSLQARYYTKVKRDEIGGRYGILLEQDPQVFLSFINALPADDLVRQGLRIIPVNRNTILTYAHLTPEDIVPLKRRLREIDKSMASKLGSEREGGQLLSGYKEFLFRALRYSAIEREEQVKIANRIKDIEAVECSIAHLTDLIDIFDTKGYGLWKCTLHKKDITIPVPPEGIGEKTILSYNRYNQLKHLLKFELGDGEQASLSVNLQFSRDPRKKKDDLYLKVQLVNTSTKFVQSANDSRYFSAFNEVVNKRTFFGVKLLVQSRHLLPYRKVAVPTDSSSFNEEEVTAVLYEQFEDYAIGHGTSVKWDAAQLLVETEYIPSFDTPDVDPTPRRKDVLIKKGDIYEPEAIFSDLRYLQFKTLSTLSDSSDAAVLAGLTAFVEAYAQWIDRKRAAYRSAPFERVALQELDKCTVDMERMRSNIHKLLAGTHNAGHLLSFRLMNTAMFMQLWHSVMVKKEAVGSYIDGSFSSFDEVFYSQRQDDLFETGVSAAWRPFQLAFILLNLDGILKRDDDPQWSKRNDLVDLVWFPTGGGKTEAYLGIIALTILHRRRTYGAEGGGTAVIMRYTLRLLTLQQFQRASLLIMALELIRRWDRYKLGKEPIYIGMWVGQGTLPNSLDELEKAYQKMHGPSSKIPFNRCPWCGYPLAPDCYEWIKDRAQTFQYNRIVLRCSRPGYTCAFSTPLRSRLKRADHGPVPVSLCDEEIYQHPPALLFGTVDKFAQIAHKVTHETANRHKDSRRIFGKGNWETEKLRSGSNYLTPDLIIQDELHLLLGPLGSSVALFESAIDQLCTREENNLRLRPKVISSTATTRNTSLQIMALFDRRLNIFPKPGIECDDSFYAFYEREFNNPEGSYPTFRSKRKYMGLLPTGRTQMWMQMRLTAILLVHRAVFEAQALGEGGFTIITDLQKEVTEVMDNYHTMLTYFNSLREVGKTESQIDTYILKEIRRVFVRVMRPGKMMQGLYTHELISGELTGRLSGEEVKEELERVTKRWKPDHRFAHTDSDGIKQSGKVPPDIVVATNMISVGIDVSRFNSIIMNTMPRNLAEYIQASSRVARNTLGLVLTVHHPFRARDISHYEKFIEFHEKMYSYVEPISITPFTQKALVRYLSLYLATMLRHGNVFVERPSAGIIASYSTAQLEGLLQALLAYFINREARLAAMTDIDPLIKNLLKRANVKDVEARLREALRSWKALAMEVQADNKQLVFNNKKEGSPQEQLYVEVDEYDGNIHSEHWQVPQSLRVIEQEAVIKIKSK